MLEYDTLDKETYFEVRQPVSPENFKGRVSSVNKILRYTNLATSSKTQHFFLTGDMGIGKTSLAKFTMKCAEEKFGMTGIYVSVKGINTLNELVDAIINEILEKIPTNDVKELVKEIFGNIESLDFKVVKFKFKTTADDSDNIIKNFPYYMQNLINKLNKENGIFLVIDDINGLTESKRFVDWYKNFADSIAVKDNLNLKLYILFASYPLKLEEFVLKEPSFGRIFNQEDLLPFSDDEVKDFFKDTFEKGYIKCSDEALNIFTKFSNGLPLIMQQIGDSTFWLNDKDEITGDIALKGVMEAINEIGKKEMRSVLNLISKLNYDSLLLKLGNNKLNSFNKKDLEEISDDEKLSVIDNFLNDMVKYKILYHIGPEERQYYGFVNSLYYIYFKIKSYDFSKENIDDACGFIDLGYETNALDLEKELYEK